MTKTIQSQYVSRNLRWDGTEMNTRQHFEASEKPDRYRKQGLNIKFFDLRLFISKINRLNN